jgi:hypothetical protein
LWKVPDKVDSDEEEHLIFGLTPKEYDKVHKTGSFISKNLRKSGIIT